MTPSRALEQVQILLTERCNLRCTHCAVPYEDSPALAELDTTAWRSVIDQLIEVGVDSIVLSGGEALLREDALDLAEHACAAGVRQVAIVTNGVWPQHVSPARVAASQSRYQALHLQLSLDGATARTHDAIRGRGAFDKLVKTVAALAAAGGRVHGVNTVIHHENRHEVQAIAERVVGLGASNWRLLPVAAIGRGVSLLGPTQRTQLWAEILDALPRLRIQTGLDILAMGPIAGDDWPTTAAPQPTPSRERPARVLVGPDGDVFTCPPHRQTSLGSAASAEVNWSVLAEVALERLEKQCGHCKFRLLCVGAAVDQPSFRHACPRECP